MTRPTRNSNSSDDSWQPTLTIEQQVSDISNVVTSMASCLTTQESRLEDHASQFIESQALQRQTISEQQNTASLVQQLIGEVHKLQDHSRREDDWRHHESSQR
jgi:hypothetical protein